MAALAYDKELKPGAKFELDKSLMEKAFSKFLADRDGSVKRAEHDPVIGHNALKNHKLVK